MANTLEAVAPKLLAQGLMALRGTNVMPTLVNRDYDRDLAAKGLTVDIPIPSAVPTQDVAPGATPPNTGDIAPTVAKVTLDKWKEAPFYLTDKDVKQSMNGIIPLQASEAVKSLVNDVNADILGKYTSVYGMVGTPGVTPFGSNTKEATDARTKLNIQLAPGQDRRFVMDPSAEGNALNLRAFNDTNFAVTAQDVRDGKMARKLGFDWAMDQQVPVHAAGLSTAAVNGAGQTGNQLAFDGGVNAADGGAAVKAGDIFTIAGDAQTYAVVATTGAKAGTLTITPSIKKAPADDAVITFKPTHTVNLAFHRDAFAFASRPLADQTTGLGNIIRTATDPVTGLALRLEISREHKRTRFSYDLLWGSSLVRPELAVRVAG
ncbi:major head protein [Vibrio phage vB_VpaS_MAR10]|uniref:Major capsid protein n=1 Tax=Vibrio phage vB_VpaS_MAR10 TaxID=1229755 RepID=K7R6C5_9CAUD|nr:major head protein [Vibrio phage vB_VpaS_MAR10]AFV81266.1 major capsid protein [Vibrio phage vB_VpaS_MAR10]